MWVLFHELPYSSSLKRTVGNWMALSFRNKQHYFRFHVMYKSQKGGLGG